MDLFSSSERDEVRSAFDDIHDSFKKAVIVFSKSVTSYSGQNSEHNYLFNRDKPVTVSEPSYSQETIYARVKFMDRHEIAKIPGLSSQTNINLPEGLLRIKILDSDYNKVRKAAKFAYEGVTYTLFSDPVKIGPFTHDYYACYLKRADA
jgi:hypothetical protein